MDISSLSSSSSASAGAPAGTAAQNPATAISQFKAQQSGQLLSLLPAPPSGPGVGLNVDIYAAVGMQAQGYLSGGLMAVELASISLGIDMSKSSQAANGSGSSASAAGTTASTSGSGTDASSSTGGTDAATSTSATASATAAPAAGIHSNAMVDQILKEDGYQAPTENDYSVQTDFFADADSAVPSSSADASAPAASSSASTSAPDASTTYYTNPSLSNPGLGGLLDSLG